MKTLFLIFICFILFAFLSATIINIPADQPTIQAGIDIAIDADTVLVQPETYFENINYNGKNITVASLFFTTQDTTYISQTIIDGDSIDSVVTFESGEDSTAVLCGFTITNGFTSGYVPECCGGGIYCEYSSPSLVNVTISGNFAYGYGGGIYCYQSSPDLENVTISDNPATYNGGGICCWDGSSPSLLNVLIQGNYVQEFGGGIWCVNSSPSLENVTISDNFALENGGGIYCVESNPSLLNVSIINNLGSGGGGGIYFYGISSPNLENVIISGNYAGSGGGILCDNYTSPSLVNVIISENFTFGTYGSGGGIFCCHSSSPVFVNVTITGNSANEGGGIYCSYGANSNLTNCVLWNDSPEEIYFKGDDDPNSIIISYSDIQGGEAGIVTNNNGTVYWLEGNINENPLFVGTGDHPFMLQDLSPCVNAGIPDTTGLNLPEFDLAGNPRVYGGRIDMGAYENQNVIVNTDEDLIPLVTKLNQNYPNPFNPTTTINYSLKEDSKVSLIIYNIKGQKVKTLVNEVLSVGEHSIVWDGRDFNGKRVSSGIYLYRLQTGSDEHVRKMLLLK